MKLARRKFLSLAAGTMVFQAAARHAWAPSYPARPVRVIAPFAAGGAPDTLARLLGQWLSEHLGQPFVVENRPGAGSNIGTEVVVRAAADGYTLLVIASSSAINATLYDNLHFNFIRDIAPVASFVRQPLVLLANPSLPAITLPEFIGYARANPGKINMASPGIGTGPHLAGELFKMMTGVDMVHVPYRGASAALADLLGGRVQVMFPATAASIENINEGKLRALAVTTSMRSEALPDVPTIGEFVPGYDASTWFGIGAPKDVSAEVIDRLNKEINAGLADPKMRERLASPGGGVFSTSPDQFGGFIAEEMQKWAKVIKFSGIKLNEPGARRGDR